MAVNSGDSGCTSGASLRAWTNLQGLSTTLTVQQPGETNAAFSLRTSLFKDIIYSIVKGVLDEYVANGESYNVAGSVENYIAGAGSNGGSLIASIYPVVGGVVASNLSGKVR